MNVSRWPSQSPDLKPHRASAVLKRRVCPDVQAHLSPIHKGSVMIGCDSKRVNVCAVTYFAS